MWPKEIQGQLFHRAVVASMPPPVKNNLKEGIATQRIAHVTSADVCAGMGSLRALELSNATGSGEMDRISCRPPATAVLAPDSPEPLIVIADQIDSEAIVVEGPTGRRDRVAVYSCEVSTVELLLLGERAKAAGQTRIQIQIAAHF